MSSASILSVLAIVFCSAVAISVNLRIAGEIKLAHTGQFPWMASIRLDNEFACAGTLIYGRWVLTSAACVGLYIGMPGRLTVLLGGLSMAGEPEPGRMEYSVDEVYHHYSYEDDDYYHYNLGLLHLSKEATGNNIGSAKVPPGNSATIPGGYQGDFAGWGGNSNAAPTALLKYAQLKTITSVDCGTLLGVNITDAELCTNTYSATGPNTTASPCWYDHGGAFTSKDSAGNAYVMGVAAYPGCTDVTRPSVFINPSHWENRNWITNITGYWN